MKIGSRGRRRSSFSGPSSAEQLTLAEKQSLEPRPRHRPKKRPEIVFGVEPVREIFAAAPDRVLKLYVKHGMEARFEQQMHAVNESGGHVVAVDRNELARLAGSEARHQGIVVELREYSYASLEEVIARQPDPLLIVDGVTDPRNLGAILRATECAGAGAIVLAKDRTVGITPAAIKSSAGAWAHLSVAKCGNVAQTLENLRSAGYWIAAMDPQGDTSIYDLDADLRLALVVGSEGRGIRAIVRKTADFAVRIPMLGRVGSLNVAVAAAVALFEIVHRRLSSRRPKIQPLVAEQP